VTADGARLRDSITRFPSKALVVVGDLIVDEYLYGKPARISREAPVLILRFTEREARLGGAANASHNVHTLGARVVPIGVVGQDAAGTEMCALLRAAGIPTAGVVVEADRPTPIKTRIMAGGYQSTRQQVVRVDREPPTGPEPATEDLLCARLAALSGGADAIIVSDYGYGTVTPRVYHEVQALARRSGAIVTVDSRYELPRFRGATAATPNEPEVEHLTGLAVDDEPGLEKAGRQLIDRLEARYLLVTRGSRGLALMEQEGGTTLIPVFGSDEIADVTGAGDTVISAFTVALAESGRPVEAARIANVAGGIVVMKRGTATVDRQELLEALANGRPRGAREPDVRRAPRP
jgi:D-glycero-beta-D-manno-heptose-7-phosphate kinase